MKISVIICCYNSKDRLRPTLEALAKQQADNISWEIVIVNNNSNDSTTEVAQQLWTEFNCAISFKIVDEKEPGLSNARRKGVSVALGEYILFCDDDNWLAPDYIQKAIQIMDGDQQLGALCGYNAPIFEVPPIQIVLDQINSFACGALAKESTYLEGAIAPWGAGLVVRAFLFKNFLKVGFESLLSDRKGAALSSGGDTEYCYLIKLMGYKWRYDTRLSLKHFLPKERARLEYLKKLQFGFGNAVATIEWYYASGNLKNLQQNHPKWLNVYIAQKLLFLKRPYSTDKEVKELEEFYRKGYLSQLKKDRTVFKKNRAYVLGIIKQLSNA